MSAVLEVTVVSAKDLPSKDKLGKSDPYCVVECGTASAKTKSISNTLEPQWNETLKLKVNETDCDVIFTVWDKNTVSKDELMCFSMASISLIEKNENKSVTLSLKGSDKNPVLTLKLNPLFETAATKQKNLSKQFEQLRVEQGEKDSKNQTALQSAANLQMEKAALHNQVQTLSSQLQIAQSESEKLRAEQKELQQEKAESDKKRAALEKDLEKVLQASAGKGDQGAMLKDQLDRMKKEVDEARGERQKGDAECQQLKDQVFKLQSDVTRLEGEKKSLQRVPGRGAGDGAAAGGVQMQAHTFAAVLAAVSAATVGIFMSVQSIAK